MNDTKHENSSAYMSGILQGKAYRVLQNHLTQVLEIYDISILEWKVLGLLFDHTELNVADIAHMMSVDPPLITRIVNGLVQKNLVLKRIPEKDKRITMIGISTIGKELIPKAEVSVKEGIGKLFIGITQEEFITYVKVLKTITKQGELLKIKHNYTLE